MIMTKLLDFSDASYSDFKLGLDLEEVVRGDIISDVIRWQLAKKRAGTHKTKGRSEVSGTTKKPYRQKGTGRARQGSLRSPQFRTGGVVFGPVVRDHSYSINKKIRKKALSMAVSYKSNADSLFVAKGLEAFSGKTSDDLKILYAFDFMRVALSKKSKVLFVTDYDKNSDCYKGLRNIIGISFLHSRGLNVASLMMSDYVIFDQSDVEYIQGRLTC
ncbi:MAG: 50S ribosomal protein L4 [Candidatus Xenolissoclinum pacificiensis L6]|uniref:Large ribosomal subunit protein uL4 n=1 Tax=Candidatus Xenolissoclinum pacificiensis L6 TaxID=1401685 RepID=W2V1L3_9RICK|nr:MAG: 50S ribosomal protein L4 [Candidatus Xenolissoclinum pacificiensis L6]